MTDLTPDLHNAATTIIRAIEGTADDVECWTQEHEGPWDDMTNAQFTALLKYIDTKIMRCADCDYLVPVHDLDDHDLCYTCKPAQS